MAPGKLLLEELMLPAAVRLLCFRIAYMQSLWVIEYF